MIFNTGVTDYEGIKKVLSKQEEHDGRFDIIDADHSDIKTLITNFNSGLTMREVLVAVHGSYVEFEIPATYTVKIPPYVSKIKVTACGGGGAGCGDYYGNSSSWGGGAGGGGGAAVLNKEIEVTTNTIYTVVVGAGGLYVYDSTDATIRDGKTTTIGDFLTLNGGTGAVYKNTSSGAVAGVSGGTGGGNGGQGDIYSSKLKQSATNGEDGVLGKGGSAESDSSTGYKCGGGGGSLGDGGDACEYWDDDNGNKLASIHGVRGGGGAGTGSGGGDGGDGYVKIEWIWDI